ATLVSSVGLDRLNKKQYRNLLVIRELYRQQAIMFESASSGIEDRMVSISQPHVRPIVRGKKTARVEFRAKMSVSLVAGYSFLDHPSWDAYHAGERLRTSVDTSAARYAYYPEAGVADTAARTRGNRSCCKQLAIRLSGPKLG